MRILPALALGVCLAATANADKRLDQAVAKSQAQLAKGREDEAVRILEKAAASAPRDAEAQLALAELLARLGRPAAPAFEEAGRRAGTQPAPLRARVLLARSSYALRLGTSRDALALANEAVELQPDAASLSALARAQARRGAAGARATAARAVEMAPASAPSHAALGDALLAARLGEEAATAYRRALEIAPRDVRAAVGLALALASSGNGGAATEAAHTAVQLDARAAEAQAALALAVIARDSQDAASEAAVAAQQARLSAPDSPLVQHTLGRVFASRGQAEQATAAWQEAVRLDPSWATPRVAMLELRSRTDAAGALAELRAAPEEILACGESQLLLGRLLLRAGDPLGAQAALDRAAEALPGAAELHAALGDAAYENGDLTVAAEAYGRAARFGPGDLDARTRHAVFLSRAGRHEEALAAMLEVAAAPRGRTEQSLMTLGEIYAAFAPPRVAESVEAFQEAGKLATGKAQATLAVARTYRKARLWEKAVLAYERASTQDRRREREAFLGIAWCYYRSGDNYKAAFFTGLAARAGADVSGLRRNLGQPPWPADELDELSAQMRSKHPGEQARAVAGLAALGRVGAAPLATALRQPRSAIAVREAIVAALGRMGAAARDALPTLERMIQNGPAGAGEREARLVSAMRDAASKVRAD